ncbi:MAG: 50S ribosomal protein L18 [Candidatus Omnitrophica bacterium]|nr:50S ribosomal protein L18 [Candidatus Omnitrophota bacterium]
MAQIQERKLSRLRRHLRIKKKVYGTSEKPRLSVYRSLNHLIVQFIDDVNQKTLIAFSTQDKEFRKKIKSTGSIEAATKLGEMFGPKVLQQGIKKIAFDRGGYLYHGRIKAIADSLRKAGLEF